MNRRATKHHIIRKRAPVILTVMLGLGAVSGCATKGDIETLQLQMDALKQTSAEALAEAKAANERANANQAELEAVRGTARSALKLAEDNDLKINQAFNQSLKK